MYTLLEVYFFYSRFSYTITVHVFSVAYYFLGIDVIDPISFFGSTGLEVRILHIITLV